MRGLLISILLGPFFCYAQSSTAFVWEASTSVNYKIGKDWSMNTSIAKRTLWLENDAFGEDGLDARLAFAELNQFGTYRINPSLKASLGYKYRWLDPTEEVGFFEHRVTQQLTLLHRTSVVRLASRIRSEQRFRNNTFTQRLRYRLSIDFPLSGESIDAKEFYFLASNELTYELSQDFNNPWGNRIAAGLGYLFSEITKLQLSFIYRSDNFTQDTQNRLFAETSLFFNVLSRP